MPSRSTRATTDIYGYHVGVTVFGGSVELELDGRGVNTDTEDGHPGSIIKRKYVALTRPQAEALVEHLTWAIGELSG